MPVVAMLGRFHFYEGYAMETTTYPIRIFSKLGIKYLIVTNAAGSLNKQYQIGDIVVIKDHINIAGMAGFNPLRGTNLDQFGTRFPAMTDPYDLKLRRDVVLKAAEKASIGDVQIGTYAFSAGPSYETKAECAFLRMVGADVVGMSTVPEVIVANHCGMKVIGLSMVTNKCILSEQDPHVNNVAVIPPSHEEVLANSKLRAKDMEMLVIQIVAELSNIEKTDAI